MEKWQSIQQIVLGKLDSYTENNEIRIFPYSNWFLNIEPALCIWDKSLLVVVY